MKHPKRIFCNSSFSLIETIIALGVVTIITGAVTLYLGSGLNLWSKARTLTELEHNSRLALFWIGRDIREAREIKYADAGKIKLLKRGVAQELVTYQYDPNHQTLKRFSTTVSPNGEILLKRASSFNFIYHDSSALINPDPVANPNTGISVAELKQLKLIGIIFKTTLNNSSLDSLVSITPKFP